MAFKENEKYDSLLLKFQENCNLKEIKDLFNYNEDLQSVKSNLSNAITDLETEKEEKKK
jgi:hypothetical protein